MNASDVKYTRHKQSLQVFFEFSANRAEGE